MLDGSYGRWAVHRHARATGEPAEHVTRDMAMRSEGADEFGAEMCEPSTQV
jgi:hypothetical protein